jgi:dynein heavy chain
MSALKMLANFRRILLRQSLSADLDDKFLTIFKQYGAEVQRVEDLYNKECARPPLSRNTPSVTGAIRWARQLLDRIYGPMQVFTQHPHVSLVHFFMFAPITAQFVLLASPSCSDLCAD